ncbi:sulfate adenylyltransferase subunit CysN [Hyphobacterium sp. CCMP332]|uniref:sulfate adenylyltransferase subunit CysN n=1 Tax=Hyphobacterium sp. CCMP332 TaxID=2749086 RepID=UPI00164F2638|nr:sulfate adenylyltransferase subunit CysN [Hyphobacterium sp. CCMP332]QNL17884.1 sulfate adenylyltransferase subunit CysN [Hyphobacterium sp. CCMP332]
MAKTETRAEMIARLTRAGDRGVLRFITCGSVDDGKSTLIGRLLFDSKLLFEDQIRILENESKKYGTAGEGIDFALLLDGLEAEREQGITIDVAYRFFNTEKRKFIVADTPGHEQFTRNMATGASTADLAIILIDARKGILPQTRRHTYIAKMMGIRHIVLAINKMDLAEYDERRFAEIAREYMSDTRGLEFNTLTTIPISARHGDNIFSRSDNTRWYSGPTLLEHLESVDAATEGETDFPFRMPVQWVNRPNLDFRGFSGTIAAGEVSVGDEVVVAHSGKSGLVSRLVTADEDLKTAVAGDAVTVLLDREIDIARGDMLVDAKARPALDNQFSAEVLWMSEEPLLQGRSYIIKAGAQISPATVTKLQHKVDIHTYKTESGSSLDLNEIGVCHFNTARPIAFDPYDALRETGSFVIIDRYTNQTVGAGMIQGSLRESSDIHRHVMDVTKQHRAEMKAQKPAIIWFTGLSGAGKSTVANLVEAKLAASGVHTYSLDGDNIRFGLNKDLGFKDADRVENIRRIGEVASLFVDAGIIVTCSFISPFRSERRMVRELVGESEFIEVFVDAPLDVCAQRDPKGLYEKARKGELRNFTGIDSPYETPLRAEITVKTDEITPEQAADQVVGELVKRGLLG